MTKYMLYLWVMMGVLSFVSCDDNDRLYITDEPGYTFETVETTDLQNGCKLYHIEEEKTPWNIYAIEVDLTNSKNQIVASLANDKVAWNNGLADFVNKETLESMISRNVAGGQDVIAGLNGDFFHMGNGMQFVTTVHNGNVGSTGITQQPHSALMVDDKGVPYIGLADMKSVLMIGNRERMINSYNGVRYADFLVVYNAFLKDGNNQSGANPWGCEVLVEKVNPNQVGINGIHEYKVLEVDNVMDNVRLTMTNPETQLIISGHGAARLFVMDLTPGEIVKINNTYEGIENDVKICEVIGGWGQFVKEGLNNAIYSITVEGSMAHEKQRHPRSCVGYNKDKTKFYMVAIEGRSDLSKGMSLDDMAYFMKKKFDVWDALNFDGGGSSTLMNGENTVNNLSGGAQRSISNAILVLDK